MGEVVLGIGTSHSPMLNATAEEWARFAPRDPTLPFYDRDGEPTTYEALLALAAGRFDGECTPARFAERVQIAHAALERIAGEMTPWPEWFAAIQSRYYPESGRTEYPVDAALARHLAAHLVANGFDAAASDRLPRGEGEGHAFAFVHRRLLRDATKLPIVPVFLNTYYPPNQPTPARCHAIGRAIRAAIESYPAPVGVGVLASGGLSHFAIDEAFDRGIIAAMRAGDAAALAALPVRRLNSGNSEIRNWIAAAGSLEHLPLAWVEYVPAYRSQAGTGTGLCFAAWGA